VARILITGSADGLGRAAAHTLLQDGTTSSPTRAIASGSPPLLDPLARFTGVTLA
jgi:NAD(P)-dependent dehydrogenase (short-subunit alcohol dehydrogenase family)